MADVSKIKLPDGITYDVKDTTKQPLLVSGTNIKTINNQSLLGSGDLTINTGLLNLVDGSAAGSVRGIGTATEDSSYTIGRWATAEGYGTKASGAQSHAEGGGSIASQVSAHAEGNSTMARGMGSHAEGSETIADAMGAHAEGIITSAEDVAAHSSGWSTVAKGCAQTVIGRYNDYSNSNDWSGNHYFVGDISDKNDAAKAFEIGNGIADDNRSNCFSVDWAGNVEATGDIIDGSGNVLSDKADASSLATVAVSGSYNDLSNKPTNVSAFTNDAGYITGYTETDPTVPSWAKASTKPTYMASEISGLMDFFYPVGSYYESSMSSAIPSGTYPPTQADLDLLGVSWFNPNYAWGGEWVLETEGHVHVSSGTNYTVNGANLDSGRGVKDGGDKDAILVSHNHTFTGNALGSHDHTFTGNALGNHSHKPSNSDDFIYGNSLGTRSIKPGTGTAVTNNWYGSGTHGHVSSTNSVSAGTPSGTVGGKSAGTPSGSISTEGSGGTDANMQPYIVVNRWHRTA